MFFKIIYTVFDEKIMCSRIWRKSINQICKKDHQNCNIDFLVVLDRGVAHIISDMVGKKQQVPCGGTELRGMKSMIHNKLANNHEILFVKLLTLYFDLLGAKKKLRAKVHGSRGWTKFSLHNLCHHKTQQSRSRMTCYSLTVAYRDLGCMGCWYTLFHIHVTDKLQHN